MIRTFPLLVLLAASLRAAEFPISQPEVVPFVLDERTVNGIPSVAAGEEGFLVLWPMTIGTSNALTWIRAYDGDGPRLPVASSWSGSVAPRAVWTGSEFLVAYTPLGGRFTAVPQPELEILRVEADGRGVRFARDIPFGGRLGFVEGLAWDGAYAAALLRFDDGTFSVFLLDRDGQLVTETPVAGEPTDVAARPGGGFFIVQRAQGVAVAAAGISFAAIDHSEEGVVARILDASGAERDRFVVAPSGTAASSIAWTGSEWVTAYLDGAQVCTARFRRGTDIRTDCRPAPDAGSPLVAAGAEGTLTVWRQGGQIVTDKGMASTRYSFAGIPAAVVDDTGLLVAWEGPADGSLRIHLGGRAHDGTPRPEVVLPGESSQREPRLSRSAGQTLLVWVEGTHLRATRVDASGRPIDRPVDLGDSFPFWPRIAAREGAWLVAWQSGSSSVYTRLVSPSLVLSEPEGFGGHLAGTPAVTATPEGYLLVWNEQRSARAAVAQRLDAGGRPVGESFVVFNDGTYPAVACNDVLCVVTAFDDRGMIARTVRHDSSALSASRIIAPVPRGSGAVILMLPGGSFQVHVGGRIVYLDRDGLPRNALRWSDGDVVLGDAVIWNGRTTTVFMTGMRMPDGFTTTRVMAFQFPSRLRSVRH